MSKIHNDPISRHRKAQQYNPKPKRLRPSEPRNHAPRLLNDAEPTELPNLPAAASTSSSRRSTNSRHYNRTSVGGIFTLVTLATASCLSHPLNQSALGAGAGIAPAGGPFPKLGGGRRMLQTQTPPAASFGTMALHTDKIGFYVVPDLDVEYTTGNDTESPCPWPTTQATLEKIQSVFPTKLRWDEELGHYLNTVDLVRSFISCTNATNTPLILTASAVDGYNNLWANDNKQPTISIEDIANGPYINTSRDLMLEFPNIPFVETINEVDGIWFDADPNNVTAFNYYMDKMTEAFEGYTDRILGPSTAFRNSPIYLDYLQRPNTPIISYHTYSGASSLSLVPGKQAYITEYGGMALNPGAVLADYMQLMQSNILADNDEDTGSIAMLFYNQFTDNGDNRGALNHAVLEGDHFAFRDWFRALMFVRQASTIAPLAYSDFNQDFLATDNGQGKFAVLFWNNYAQPITNGSRSMFGTSLTASSPLHVATVVPGDFNTSVCNPMAEQNVVNLQLVDGIAVLQPRNLAPGAATLVSTEPCDAIVD